MHLSGILSRTDLQSIDNLGQSLDDLSFEACEVPVQRSQSCLSLSVVLRESDGPSRSRPDSFASIPNEHGRSIDSSHGSWDLETRYISFYYISWVDFNIDSSSYFQYNML